MLDLIKLEQKLVATLYEVFDVDGVTIVENNGSIMDKGTHLHVHVIPRFLSDGFWDNQTLMPHENDVKLLTEKLLTGL